MNNADSSLPGPDVAPPPCPDRLSKEARRHWRRLAPVLHRRGLLLPLDMEAFETLCSLLGQIDVLGKQLAAEGYVVKDSRGRQYGHPSVKSHQLLLAEARHWLRMFHLDVARPIPLDALCDKGTRGPRNGA